MKQLTVWTVFLLVLACGAPTPSITPQPTPSTTPHPTPSLGPTASPAPTLSPSPAPTLSRVVTRELEGWTPVCGDVPTVDCFGVAALFVNNLARSQGSVLQESGGVVSVEPRPDCPLVPDWADPRFCWQASAPTSRGEVCMVVARQTDLVGRFGFGQVGGGNFSGPIEMPGQPTRPPCV